MILTKCYFIGANWCLNMAIGTSDWSIFQKSSINKLLNQLKPNIVRMILARFFLSVVTLVLISQPRWPPWQELASTYDDIGKWKVVKTFLRNDEMIELKLYMNYYGIDPYKDGIFYVDQKTKMATLQELVLMIGP